MKTTEELARFVVTTRWGDIPGDVVEVSKRSILDCIGVMLVGARDTIGHIMRGHASDLGGAPQSSVVCGDFKTSTPSAAFANGTMAHALDYDDFSYNGHPTASMLPAVLAIGEWLNLSGRTSLEALIVGYEVYGKMGAASGELYSSGWHPTAVFGTMGATAAAAKMLNLDIDKTRIAFGIAASQTSGLKQNFGTMTKPFHAGNAGRSGIVSALLAKQGFTANQNIIEDPAGFAAVFLSNPDLVKMTGNLGNPYRLVTAGPSIKKYPSCGANHRPLDAILQLMAEHNISYDDIDSVEVEVSPLITRIVIYSDPQTGFQGKFSLEYNLAAAILDGVVGLKTFTDEKAKSPQMREALKKARVKVNPEWALDLGSPTPVTVTLRNGTRFTKQVDAPRGSPQVPLIRDELIAKFEDCAEGSLASEEMQKVIELVENFESLDNLEELMGYLRTAPM